MSIDFTAHNIRLDDGISTKPGSGPLMDAHPWFLAAKRVLETVFPGDKSRFRIADLGCLEGGYSVEFARMGFQVLGLEVRDSNMAACRYVKDMTRLPNLEFVQDNVWNVKAHGTFDAMFCCGLIYHLDQPRRFLELLASVTTKLLILQTHFSTEDRNRKHGLSPLTENESLPGRWYKEFKSDAAFQNRESSRWAAWDNKRSFWIRREYLIQAIQDAGFDLVMEQFDGLGRDIAGSLTRGYYKTDERGTFIGIKTGSGGPRPT